MQSLAGKKEKQVRHVIYAGGDSWGKVIDFTDDPVIQCDVPPAVKKTSLHDDNDDCKWTLTGILNVLFLELILCIVLVS